MPGMVAHAEQALDERGDALQGPDLGGIAPRARTLEQRVLKLLVLVGSELGRAALRGLGAGGLRSALLPLVVPDAHSIIADVQGLSDITDGLAALKAGNRFLLDGLPLGESAPGVVTACSCCHDYPYSTTTREHFLLCESQ